MGTPCNRRPSARPAPAWLLLETVSFVSYAHLPWHTFIPLHTAALQSPTQTMSPRLPLALLAQACHTVGFWLRPDVPDVQVPSRWQPTRPPPASAR
jgi:hypothetical protein